MAEEAVSVSPPYATYRQFINFISILKDTAIPSRVDRSVFGGMSGGTAYSLLSALKFLKLIDDLGHPRAIFRELVEADEVQRKPIMQTVLTDAYPTLLGGDLNLAEASSGQFDEHIREQYKSKGSTIDKQALFFLNAAEDAGITLSNHLKARRPSAPSSSSKKRPARKVEPPHSATPLPEIKAPQIQPQRSLSHVLTDLLDVNDMTEEEMAAVWTLLRYQKRKEATAPLANKE